MGEKYDAYLKTPEGEAALKSLKEERKEAKQADIKKAVKKAATSVEKDENLKSQRRLIFCGLVLTARKSQRCWALQRAQMSARRVANSGVSSLQKRRSRLRRKQ